MRFLHFRARLNEVLDAYPHIKAVHYEEVRRHLSTDSAHVYGGMLAILTSWCEEKGLPYEGVPVGTAKLRWCGKGNAGKDLMISEAVYRGYTPIDDNEVDALAVFNVVQPLPDISHGTLKRDVEEKAA
jgi:crossover junction endodeoxyribonuclease RuvC